MKRVVSFLFVCLLVMSMFSGTVALAETNPADLTPKNLKAALMPEDQTHPYGSALLTFHIDNLPMDTGDTTLTWYVGFERKIGAGAWIGVGQVPTATMVASHATGGGGYQYEQIWVEDYAWKGEETISYRVYVLLEDLIGNRGGMSGYSNVAALGITASPWAVSDVEAAQGYGLVPDILSGKDLSKMVTREEFCELAVLLYEEVTGESAAAASPNPFTDTSNPRILKALSLGITTGVSQTQFKPNDQIPREQCATMLFRAIKAIAPGGDYRVDGAKPFADQQHISGWALDAARYMSLKGIVKGDPSGNFMPKAVTTDQIAKNYGLATREAAIIMSKRTYEDMTGTGASSSGQTDTSDRGQPPTTSPSQVAGPEVGSNTPAPVASHPLVGVWSRDGASGTLVDPATGYATGSIYNGEWYVFREDGTFRYVIVGSGTVISGGVVVEGKYRVVDDTVEMTGVFESWYPNPARTDQTPAYTNKAGLDRTLPFEVSADGTQVVIGGTDTFYRA